GLVELTPNDPAGPTKVTLQAQLVAGGRTVRNDWCTWLYPAKVPAPKLKLPLFATGWALKALRPLGAAPVGRGPLGGAGVYVTEWLDRDLLAAMDQGARLVLLGGESTLPASPTTFKTAWWHGGGRDINCGTVVYDHDVTRAMAPEGWCDAGWYRLLQGANAFVLDALPQRPSVLIRMVPVLHEVSDRALLLEARVGKGRVVLSGLNHRAAAERPEGEWLLAKLVEHAANAPAPRETLPRELLAAQIPPDGPYLSGFRRLVRNEGETGKWHSYREDNVTQPTCRQTKVGNLVEWETAPLPTDWKGRHATFVFAGGLGWKSQPRTKGFAFLLDGRDVLRFDLAPAGYAAPWTSADKKVSLRFVVRRRLPQDELGLFYVTVSRDLLAPAKCCRLGVRSLGTGSRRWFGLHLYRWQEGEKG
ncbi:MAG: hypothetical protein WBF17_06865, partial [Phycisphaerae bacterium]